VTVVNATVVNATVVNATVVKFPRRSWLPADPAFGRSEPLGWWRGGLRLLGLAVLLALTLLVRASGVLHPAAAGPPLPPGAALVEPGVLRGGQPQDLDLANLRDRFRVRAVVDVDDTSVDEQAVAGGLGLRLLALHLYGTAAPSADDVLALVRFVRGAGGAGGAVYLHDSTGHGPVLVVAAVLRLLRGVPLTTVLRQLSRDEIASLSMEQLLALYEVQAVVRGVEPVPVRYAALRGVTW
jgi:hypothetical protein